MKTLWTVDTLSDGNSYFVRTADGVEPRIIICSGLTRKQAADIVNAHNGDV